MKSKYFTGSSTLDPNWNHLSLYSCYNLVYKCEILNQNVDVEFYSWFNLLESRTSKEEKKKWIIGLRCVYLFINNLFSEIRNHAEINNKYSGTVSLHAGKSKLLNQRQNEMKSTETKLDPPRAIYFLYTTLGPPKPPWTHFLCLRGHVSDH